MRNKIINTGSGKDYWNTPPEVFDFIKNGLRLNIDLDACAENGSQKSALYINEEMDAFKTNWIEAAKKENPVVFVNPPFSKKREFLNMIQHYYQNGCTVIAVIPAEPCTGWWRFGVDGKAVAVYYPKSRISYINNETKKKEGSPNFPSAICLFAPWGGSCSTQYQYIDLKDYDEI